MRDFSIATNDYLNTIYRRLEERFNLYNTYKDFNAFNVSRFQLHNHLLFSLLEVTSNGIADAIQFIGSDHKDMKTEITFIIENENGRDKAVEELDAVDSYGLPQEDINGIMSFKGQYGKLLHISLNVRDCNTRDQLIQKFIGFYAEDYIRMRLHDSKNNDAIKTYDDEYWYAKFHHLGFRSIFFELFNLDFKFETDSIYDSKKVGKLVVAVNSTDKVLGRLSVIKGAVGVPYNVTTVELPIVDKKR